jgi:2-aminoadipate transaminase
MDWEKLFASRTAQMRRSAIRELLKVTAHPDMISFAGGLPAPELFPIQEIERACGQVLTQHGGRALQYGETEGVAELRDWIAGRVAREGLSIGRENVMIVSGAQQGLDLIGRVLLDHGDKVIVENPTYLALLSAWRPLGVIFLPAPSDADGMRVEVIEPLLREHPKLVYVVANFHNPQGTTLSLERREQLVNLARQYGVGVVEDDPYGELRLHGPPLPSLFSISSRDHEPQKNSVIRVGTFSKVLAPGLRVGWIIAAEGVIERLVRAKQAIDLHTSTFNQLII